VQNELRKVVNNLIGLHGKPDLIRIELARDVGKSKRDRHVRLHHVERLPAEVVARIGKPRGGEDPDLPRPVGAVERPGMNPAK
jgi:hypothetical protein